MLHEVVDEEGRQPTAGPGLVDALRMDVDSAEEQLRMEGGEEMGGGMRLLVPRLSHGGKLFVGTFSLYCVGIDTIAPIPIKYHLLLSPRPPQPVTESPTDETHALPSFLSTTTPSSTTGLSKEMQGVLPGKRAQPLHLLKFRNKAYGFDTPGPASKTEKAAPLASQTQHKEKRRKHEKNESPRKKTKT